MFTVTIFLGAALLFILEPMFARMVLPLLGGSPGVWITSVLVFQALLLAGYAYAHLSVSRFGPRRQSMLHMALVGLPILLLPIAVPSGWTPPAQEKPALWLIAVMGVSVAFPFLMISSASPLLQRWFAATRHTRARDPYFLFRASNLGSMVGLLSYPVLLEHTLGLAEQSRLWSVGYVLLVLLVVACAVVVRRSPRREEEPPIGSPASAAPEMTGPTAVRRLRWMVLAFVPSSLMLGATNFLTTDISPVPLLWVLPLAIYLISFVIAFSPAYPRRRGIVTKAVPFLVLTLAATMLLQAGGPLWLLLSLHLLVLLAASVMCHGELAIDRPSPRHLTSFYLWISFGGVLGGAFNAIVAPLLFNSFVEYPLAIAAVCVLLPWPDRRRSGTWVRAMDVALPAVLAAALLVAASLTPRFGSVEPYVVAAGILLLVVFSLRARPVRFGLAVGALLLAGAIPEIAERQVLMQERSFFGVYRVEEVSDVRSRLLFDGTTLHGAQILDPSRRLEPTTYFTTTGPVGDVFASWIGRPQGARIGVVGLGTGSLACYGARGERWTFFEIDPVVERIARDPSLFTFLRDCPSEQRVVLGDGRLSLQRARPGSFDMLILDAFSSDAIPVHLITREALALYRSRLGQDGLLLFHISNRYLDLHPVLGSLAEDAGLASLARYDSTVTDADRQVWKTASIWVVMARDPAALGGLRDNPDWNPLVAGSDLWTDDYSDVFGVVSWG